MPLETYLAGRSIDGQTLRRSVEEYVRQGDINVIKGKGASEFGIGTVVARVVEIMLRDDCMVVPVSAYSEKYGVILSLPRRVGRSGVLDEFEIEENKEEQEGISKSVEALKAARKRLDRSQILQASRQENPEREDENVIESTGVQNKVSKKLIGK